MIGQGNANIVRDNECSSYRVFEITSIHVIECSCYRVFQLSGVSVIECSSYRKSTVSNNRASKDPLAAKGYKYVLPDVNNSILRPAAYI